ncbi:hypothetical protein [Marivirga arenosa]|uniref:Uncharacterized protein n=1 Tax=Marivirga arenosa TaxID=3059076 RepID=A0AA49GDA7_9BACT|nr:hypothetical protein [Marivirga sp. BKB1-2]WKK81665.2 hypothetical protein QYS47_05200 [Marivirga sp. BKB1-2]
MQLIKDKITPTFVNVKQKVITITLLLFFLCHTFMFMVIRLNFEVNRDRLAELFCVNKDEPMTMCYGSCYLNDQLKKEAEKKSSEKNTLTEQIQLDNSPKTLSIKVFNADIPNTHFYPDYSNIYKFLFEFDITHPPRLLA